MYSNSLSAIAIASTLITSELFPACFSCSNNYNLSQSSSGSDDKNIVFETPEAETNKPVDLGNFLSVRSRVNLLPVGKFISFAKSYIIFSSAELARPTLQFLLVYTFKRSLFNSNCLFVPRNVKKLSCKVIGSELCINKSLTLFEVESFTNLNSVPFFRDQ